MRDVGYEVQDAGSEVHDAGWGNELSRSRDLGAGATNGGCCASHDTPKLA